MTLSGQLYLLGGTVSNVWVTVSHILSRKCGIKNSFNQSYFTVGFHRSVLSSMVAKDHVGFAALHICLWEPDIESIYNQ